jgi:hypothetical protein
MHDPPIGEVDRVQQWRAVQVDHSGGHFAFEEVAEAEDSGVATPNYPDDI